MVARIALVISVIALLLAFSSLYINISSVQNVVAPPKISQPVQVFPSPQYGANYTSVSIYAPAVDNEGNGVATTLSVQLIPGRGRILTNINNLLFWVDTQQSIQTAKSVAENLTKVNMSNMDVIYSIDTNATVIEGPSAGGALTVATVAALKNKPLNASVMMTGTINPDGTIGPVGGILAKAKAAKDIGATLFLVPEGQGIQTTYVPKQTCEQVGSFTLCTTEYVKQTVDTRQTIGIQVVEVSSVQEALQYFLVK